MTLRRCMVERPAFRLADDDLVAGVQILGHLAFPRRADHGIYALQQWAIRRAIDRGELEFAASPIPLDKPSRLRTRIDVLERLLRRRLRAGDWLNRRGMKMAGERMVDGPVANVVRALGKGVREMTLHENYLLQFRFAPRRSDESDNMIRDYWTSSLPVIHLAQASLLAITNAYRAEGRAYWNLERTVFWPDWVPDAIEASEESAQWASGLGLVDYDKMVRFYR